MKRLDIPGGWEPDVRVGGAYVCPSVDGARLWTERGEVALPADVRVRYPRLAPGGGFAGINHYGDRVVEYSGGAWTFHEEQACGPSGVIYDAAGVLHVSQCGPVGSQGYRYVDSAGRLVTGDETYGPRNGITLYGWTDLGDGWRIGQGPDDGVYAYHGGRYRVIARYGVPARGVRAHRVGSDVALCYWVQGNQPAVLLWLTLDELAALPGVESPAAPKTYPPIPRINRPLWFGWFTFAGRVGLPANCDLPVALGQTRADVVDLDGRRLYRYVAGVPDGDLDALNRAVREERGVVPVLAYWTRGAQVRGVPDADAVAVEAYLGADETDEAFISRVAAACQRVGRVVLIANCYTSNTNNTSDPRRVPPLIAQLACDIPHVEGVLVFSGSGRATGWQDHPEVHADWRQVFVGIPGAPVVLPPLPDAPDPEHGADTDTPPDPVVAPEPNDPEIPESSPAPVPPAPPAVVIRPDKPIGGSLFGDIWRALRRINFRKLFR